MNNRDNVSYSTFDLSVDNLNKILKAKRVSEKTREIINKFKEASSKFGMKNNDIMTLVMSPSSTMEDAVEQAVNCMQTYT